MKARYRVICCELLGVIIAFSAVDACVDVKTTKPNLAQFLDGLWYIHGHKEIPESIFGYVPIRTYCRYLRPLRIGDNAYLTVEAYNFTDNAIIKQSVIGLRNISLQKDPGRLKFEFFGRVYRDWLSEVCKKLAPSYFNLKANFLYFEENRAIIYLCGKDGPYDSGKATESFWMLIRNKRPPLTERVTMKKLERLYLKSKFGESFQVEFEDC